jgi:hypothetical protein
MIENGACEGDMLTFPPADGDILPTGDPAYDAMLARMLRPDEPPRAGPGGGGLRRAPRGAVNAEANALAAFRDLVGRSADTAPRPRRRHPVLASLLSAKLAAAAITLGSAAAAAYAGKLPAPVQKLAHDTIGAPKTPGAQPAPSAAPSRRCSGGTPPTACAPPTLT